ncbi:MAG: chemotaxis protein CheD [Chloroflexota bacterium]|jgi:chemotaxis protein CheD
MGDQVIVPVGIGELRVSNSLQEVLIAYGLGSCIGVSVYDPHAKVAGLAHVMLPNSKEALSQKPLGKFADLAVPMLLEEIRRLGGQPRRLVGKIAGGAQMLIGTGFSQNGFNIGERNIHAVKAAMERHGISLVNADIGGNRGRTMALHVGTGRTTVRIIGEKEKEL